MDHAELCLVDFGFCIEMPTVISAVPTLEGLVIGSDGRSCGPDGEINSDDVQKIFPVDSRGGKLVYALMGETTFGYSDTGALFDFRIEVPCSLELWGTHDNPGDYLNALGISLQNKLNLAREVLGLAPTVGLQTTIVVGGFYENVQGLGYVSLTHGARRTERQNYNFPPGGSFPFGSVQLVELMHAGDSRFAKYAHPQRMRLETLQQGIDRVHKDILLHYDPEARKVNDKACSHIGGRIQIATVTLADGFKWVPGFESAGFTSP